VGSVDTSIDAEVANTEPVGTLLGYSPVLSYNLKYPKPVGLPVLANLNLPTSRVLPSPSKLCPSASSES
jgi:hypothetical protein